ncbi:MAG TPA: glycoside hydrolase family 66 protein [Acidimicrobiales bacterium]|nr:glycoside hydrolase family 66 protein [Acidimicrobiales bacterium]
MPLSDLRAFYRTGEEIALEALPVYAARVVARRADGGIAEADVVRGGAHFPGLAPGTYSVEALTADESVLADELTTVGAHAGERPVHGFATSFDTDNVPQTLGWLRALRCTVVQIYDWMATYTEPLGPPDGWQDPSGRPVSFDALRSLAAGIRDFGAVAHAYAPVYAMDIPFAVAHPEMLMYRNDEQPQRFLEFIELADPGNRAWQEHFVAAYGGAADAIGFNGFHIDTYGYPRAARDQHRREIDLRSGYESFLAFFRSRRPGDVVSFNQVNGVPSAIELAPGPRFRYCEVWPPNRAWRHLEGLLDRSAGVAGRTGLPGPGGDVMRGTIACYPPVWGGPGGAGAEREHSLRTVVLTEAVATCLGASALLYGDTTAALCDPYYPKHERLSAAEAATVLIWHRFALRCRDLFIEGEDTSWYEVGDENGAVSLEWEGHVSPEPVGGALFARVVHGPDRLAVGVVDLSGSSHGLWSVPTGEGRCRSVRVRALVDEPGEGWDASAAVVGRAGGRFVPLHFTVVEHRQGRAVQVDLPVDAGWSVLRLVRGSPSDRHNPR